MSNNSERNNYWFFILLFLIGAFWDVITSALGLLSIFGKFQYNSSQNILGILTDLLFKNSIGFLFAFIIGGAIVALDNWAVTNVPALIQKKRKGVDFYISFFFWFIFKQYDLYSTYIGTARCFLPSLERYPKVELEEVLSATTSEQQIVLFLISLVIVSCPIFLIIFVKKALSELDNS